MSSDKLIEIAVFPLPNLLLMKKVPMPLHIFEPRYRKMLHDCVSENRLLTVTPLKMSGDYHHEMVVAGIPQIIEKLGEGKSNILLQGDQKFELLEVVQERPYIIFKGIEVQESYQIFEGDQLMMESFKNLLVTWARNEIHDHEGLKMFLHVLRDAEVLINYTAMCLVKDMEYKRKILRCNDSQGKIELLTSALSPKEINLGPWLKPIKVN